MVEIKRSGRKTNKRVPEIIRGEFPCQWCNKTFSKETILINHFCEQRRRHNQKDTPYGRYGFKAYSAIKKSMQSKTVLTEEEFRQCDFYLACMRWARYVIDSKCLKPFVYLDWLLKNNIPIDQWTNDTIYTRWTQFYTLDEDPWIAFERGMETIVNWGATQGKDVSEYFKQVNGVVLTDVQNVKISGWMIYCSKSGKNWLSSLENGDLELVWPWLNASKWNIKLEKYKDVMEDISTICDEAGL